MKRILFLLFAGFSMCKAFSQTKKFVFYFDSGKQQPNNLKAFNDSLEKWKNHIVKIVTVNGYADSKGSEQSNLRLAEKRARKTDSVLIKIASQKTKVIPGTKKINSYGEKFPVASNKNLSGRKKNRRVEVEISVLPDAVTETKMEIPAPEKPKEPEDTTFILENGTEIKVSKCALKGIKPSELKIEAEEFFTDDQMILNGMFTRTENGQCLRTGGMLRYKITDKNGAPVQINPLCPVEISMPLIGQDTAFDLYDLKADSKEHGNGWNLRDEKVKYNKDKNRLNFRLTNSQAYINCDKLLGPAPLTPADKVLLSDVIKTKKIRNAEVFVNGGPSVLKLTRFRPKKHDKKICACIPLNEQFVTAYVKQGNGYLFCHKKLSELKVKKFFRRKIIIRKCDYKILNSYDELRTELKASFNTKNALTKK